MRITVFVGALLLAASAGADESESYYEKYRDVTSYRIETKIPPASETIRPPLVRNRIVSPPPGGERPRRQEPYPKSPSGNRVRNTDPPSIGPLDPKPSRPGSESVGGRTRSIYRSR